jgi:ubiquinone/menaquinone biosynthesis C-methylase UbiE
MSNHTNLNEASYDTYAEEWEQAMTTNLAHKYLEKPAISKLLLSNLEGKSVLCIGVGSGEELELLTKREAKDITAIDISGELLKHARSKFPSVEFYKMNMMDLSFPDSSFDVVYSSLAFHYTDDWDKLLSQVYRVLKKDGILLFSTARPEHQNAKNKTDITSINERGILLSQYKDILPGNIEILYYNHSDTNALLESVTHAGFTIREVVTPMMTTPDNTEIFDQQNYKRLNKKNTENPFFLVVLAVK